MTRDSVRLPDALRDRLETAVELDGYQNRSEVIREALREKLDDLEVKRAVRNGVVPADVVSWDRYRVEDPSRLRTDGGETETEDKYQPSYGDEIVREQLELQMRTRFSGYYNPTLVFLDNEWHYPITADVTFCGKEIPDPVLAVWNSHYSGPSTKACSTCSPPVGGVNNRTLKRQITKFLDAPMNKSGSFPREALVEILMKLEERYRSRIDEHPPDETDGDRDLRADGGSFWPQAFGPKRVVTAVCDTCGELASRETRSNSPTVEWAMKRVAARHRERNYGHVVSVRETRSQRVEEVRG